jgi:hypothetical protein
VLVPLDLAAVEILGRELVAPKQRKVAMIVGGFGPKADGT